MLASDCHGKLLSVLRHSALLIAPDFCKASVLFSRRGSIQRHLTPSRGERGPMLLAKQSKPQQLLLLRVLSVEALPFP